MSIDPRTIEGTRERAADRGQFLVTGLGDGMSLGDPALVDSLVREFIGIVVDTRNAALQGKEGDHLGRVVAVGQQYAEIFYGEDRRYEPLKPWNSATQLGVEIEHRLGLHPGDESAAFVMFIRLARNVIRLLLDHEEGRISEAVAKFRLDILVEETHALLLGWPAPTAD